MKKATRTEVPSKVRARLEEMGKPPTDRTTAIKAIGKNLPRPPQRGNSPAIAEKILTLMRRNPKRFWTTSGLAHKFGKSVKALRHLTSHMCERGLIALADEGRRLWALREAGIPTRKTVGGRIIEKLIAVEEMRYSALARAIGVDPPAMSAPVQSLRRNGGSHPPSGPKQKATIEAVSPCARQDRTGRSHSRSKEVHPVGAGRCRTK